MLAQAHSEIICGLLFFSFPSLSLPPLLTLTDHKKTYGEEHGSCQAGIAGVFTEVSRSTSMFTCVALCDGKSVLWLHVWTLTYKVWLIYSLSRVLKGIVKLKMSAIIYSPSCRSKHVRCSFFLRTQKWRCLAESKVLIPAEHLWCDFTSRPWAKNSSPNTNDLYIHRMDKSIGTLL